jgi:hypothetical protein
VPNRPFQVNGRSTLSPVSRYQGLKQEVLAHCFPVKIELACERNAYEMKGCKVENHSLFEKYPLQTKWTNSCISWHDTMCERQECLAPCLPMTNELPVEGILATTEFSHVLENHHCAI